MSSLVTSSRVGAIATITLNRPERKNALNVAMLQQLCAALESLARDSTVRCVILTGAGDSLSSGFDLAEAQDLESSLQHGELLVRAQLLLADSGPLVSIAVAHGYTLAGGGALVAACDFAVATAEAKFGYPVLKSGIVPTPGMPFLRHELRERDFRELILGGELIDGARAAAIGLVNRAVDSREAAMAAAQSFAQRVVQASPAAVAATRRFANELTRQSLRAEMERALAEYARIRRGPEAAEGLRAFIEKRPPRW